MFSPNEIRSQNTSSIVGQNLVLNVLSLQKSNQAPEDKPKLTLPEDKVNLTSAKPGLGESENANSLGEKKVILPFDESQGKSENQSSTSDDDKKAANPKLVGAKDQELDEAEKKQVSDLKKRDQEVKSHELAHMAAAGGLAHGGASFQTQMGPDGRSYAVGGHVNIDVSEGATPSETISKARQIRAAATAPADPSPQDRAVASQAAQMEAKAQKEMAQENQKLFDHGDSKKMAHEGCSGCVSNTYSAAKQYGANNPPSRLSGLAI